MEFYEGGEPMKRCILLLFLCMFLLIGCRNEEIIINYEGESDNWIITYRIEGNEKSHDSFYTFRYIGPADDSIQEVKYAIDGPKEGETSTFTLDQTREYTGKMKMTGGLPKSSDRDIKVKIEWNGKTDLLFLRRQR